MKKRRIFIRFISILAAAGTLSGCITSALSGGAQAVYNHHNLQNNIHDHYLEIQIDRAIYWKSKDFKTSHVIVDVFNDVVILTGQVPTSALKNTLTGLVKAVPDVHEVYNLTTVDNPVSTLTRVSDSWITTKIKSQLLAELEIDPAEIKVITENGVVYLIGTIYPDQALIASDIAKSTEGVQSVVRIFNYLYISRKIKEA